MKLNRLIVLLVVFAMLPFAAFAQETEGDGFVLELSAQLAALGWDDEALTEFKEAAGGLDWSGATNADPQLLAWAFDSGMPDDALTSQERAQIAHAVMTCTTEIMRLGYAQRDIAEAAMQATRETAQTMMTNQLRNETGNADLGEMIRETMRNRMHEALEPTRTAAKSRGANASGGGYGIGESEPPGFGDPVGPRDGSSDGIGDPSGPPN